MAKLKTITPEIGSFQDLVNVYNELYAPILERELELSRETIKSNQSDEDKARKILIGSSHQNRLKWQHTEREDAVKALVKAKIWESQYKDFEELYETVSNTISNLYRIGPLAVYDVTKRIGAALGIEPQKYVYVQRHALDGAKELLKEKLKIKVEKEKLDKFFNGLSAVHIENILCIMLPYFKEGNIDTSKKVTLKIWSIKKVEEYFK